MVTDLDSGQPLEAVLITVVGETKSTTTGPDGRYTLVLDDSRAGRTVTVVVQILGFKTQRQPIQLKPGSQTLHFALESQAIRVDSITVAGQARELEEARRVLLRAEAPSLVSYSMADRSTFDVSLPGRYNRNFHTEDYNHIQENVFLAAAVSLHAA